MTRRATRLTILLLGLLALTACKLAGQLVPQPTPTIYYAPATPAIYIPPAATPDISEPTTVLLLGIDRRPSGGTSNTDVVMLLHIDPDSQRAVVLSIPRDLYVEISGHGQGRINTAYSLGSRDGTGGLTLARQTASDILGVPIQHATLIDFRVFVTLIDAIGGVDVDVPYDISDPTFPDSGTGYDPFYLPAGQHHLDGATALKYARTRATPGGDFTRTARQRQIVLAVRDRVVQADMLPTLIAQAPQLWATLQDAIETDLTLPEIVSLAVVASQIPADQIATAAIDESCTDPWVTPSGASVLLPNQAAIEALVTDLFSPPPTTASTE
jgi:LCP family protein required for cell wall assembly